MPSIRTACSFAGSSPSSFQDCRRDLRSLHLAGIDRGRHRPRRIDEQRHVAVIRIVAAVLGDLAVPAGIHDADLNDPLTSG